MATNLTEELKPPKKGLVASAIGTNEPLESASPQGADYVNPDVLQDNAGDFTPSEPGPSETPESFTPETITPGTKSTVSGQMGSLLKSGNPYVEQARSDALRAANRRGLINSSIAVGEGTNAAIRNALPIAQQDASTYFEAQKSNQEAQNKFTENEQAYSMQHSLKEQEQRQYLDRLRLDHMNNEDMARLNTQLNMLSDENKAKLQTDMDILVNDAKITSQQRQLFAQESAKIMQETQAAIAEIGASGAKPDQQANAIQQLHNQQDASLTLLRDLMLNSAGWTW